MSSRISYNSPICLTSCSVKAAYNHEFLSKCFSVDAAVNQRGLIAADYKPWSVQRATRRVSQLLVLHACVQERERVAQVYVTCWRHTATKRRAAGRPTSRDTVSLKYTASNRFTRVTWVTSPFAIIWHGAENRLQSLRRRYWTGVGLVGYKHLQRAGRSVLPATNQTETLLFTAYSQHAWFQASAAK